MGSATVKVPFNLVHAVECYGRSNEFGFLPTISAPGPNFALRPSPLDSACARKSIGTNLVEIGGGRANLAARFY